MTVTLFSSRSIPTLALILVQLVKDKVTRKRYDDREKIFPVEFLIKLWIPSIFDQNNLNKQLVIPRSSSTTFFLIETRTLWFSMNLRYLGEYRESEKGLSCWLHTWLCSYLESLTQNNKIDGVLLWLLVYRLSVPGLHKGRGTRNRRGFFRWLLSDVKPPFPGTNSRLVEIWL